MVNLNLDNIKLHKVQAHTNNAIHNLLDDNIRKAYDNSNNIYPIKFHTDNSQTLQFIPLWQNIEIEENLRRFTRTLTHTYGLEQFFNLNRNNKYREQAIYWKSKFYYLNHNTTADKKEDLFY